MVNDVSGKNSFRMYRALYNNYNTLVRPQEVCTEENCNMPTKEEEKSEDDSESSAVKITGNCATAFLLCTLLFVHF